MTIAQKSMKFKRKKNDLNHDKYITPHKFRKLTSKYFAAKLAKENWGSKNDNADFIKKIDIDYKQKKN